MRNENDWKYVICWENGMSGVIRIRVKRYRYGQWKIIWSKRFWARTRAEAFTNARTAAQDAVNRDDAKLRGVPAVPASAEPPGAPVSAQGTRPYGLGPGDAARAVGGRTTAQRALDAGPSARYEEIMNPGVARLGR